MSDFGRYRVREELARGGVGAVYAAHDPSIGREVAIKALLRTSFSNKNALARFEREAKALARIDHPHVVKIYDYAISSDGDPYMVMEVVDGESLQTRLDRDGPLEPQAAAELTLKLCQAVAACHEVGVLHRDLKPDNVLLDTEGTLKLADFGLVRDVELSESQAHLTKSGTFLGSPGYWAPEQASGRLDEVGIRTDVYGIGAVLYALLTGRAPHAGASLIEIVLAVQSTPVRAASEVREGLPLQLDAIVGRALEIAPRDRYEDPQQLAAALEHYLRPVPLAPSLRSSVQQPRPPVGAVLGVALAAFLGLAWLATPSSPEPATASAQDPGSSQRAAAPPEPGPSLRVPAPRDDRPTALEPEEPEEPAPAPEPGGELTTAADYVYRARAGVTAGRWEEALADLGRAIELEPDQATLGYERAVLRESLGDKQGAFQDLSNVILLDPTHARALLLRAVIHDAQGNFRAAEIDYDGAIDQDPRLAVAYYRRGLLRVRNEDLPGARADLERALELDSTAAWARAARVHLERLVHALTVVRPDASPAPR